MAMLTNSNCAGIIGGPSAAGQVAAIGAVAGQLFGNPNSSINFSPKPDPGIGSCDGSASPSRSAPCTMLLLNDAGPSRKLVRNDGADRFLGVQRKNKL